MRTILFLAAIFISTSIKAQNVVEVHTAIFGFQPPIGQWYLFEEKEYEDMYFIDFEDENLAEEQLNATLEDMGTSMEFGNMVEYVDGFFYYEWDGIFVDVKGIPAPAQITYMMNHNNPNFFRICVKYV